MLRALLIACSENYSAIPPERMPDALRRSENHALAMWTREERCTYIVQIKHLAVLTEVGELKGVHLRLVEVPTSEEKNVSVWGAPLYIPREYLHFAV